MKCNKCNRELILSNDFDYKDYGVLDKQGNVNTYYCLNCDYEIEVYSENDQIIKILEIE